MNFRYPLAFTRRDAIPGLGSAAFSLAGNGFGGLAAAAMALCRRASARYASGSPRSC